MRKRSALAALLSCCLLGASAGAAAPFLVAGATPAPEAQLFPCDPPSVQLLANGTHAFVTLRHWSGAGQDAAPVAGRATFAFATWAAVAQPPWDPVFQNLPAAEAFSWLSAQDPFLYPGTCSVTAAAASGFTGVAQFTLAPRALQPGLGTRSLASATVQSAGCECARASTAGGLRFLQGCAYGGPQFFYSANASATFATWLLRQSVRPPGGACSLVTDALFTAELGELAGLPAARVAAFRSSRCTAKKNA
jgi:hypothetical protein